MTVGAFLEPLVVVTLLFGGAYFNRSKDYDLWEGKSGWAGDGSRKKSDDMNSLHRDVRSSGDSDELTWSSGSTPTLFPPDQPTSRTRKVQLFGYKRLVSTPNTLVFKDRFLSRLLQKFPFWRKPGIGLCCIG